MKKFLRAAALALVGSMLFLTACSSTDPAATQTEDQSRLQRVLDAGKVRVATIPDNPGWSVLGSDGNWKGYDIDIAMAFGEALGVEVEFVPTDGAGRIPMINSDKCDIVISGIVPTDERARSVAFTEPYSASGILGLCRTGEVIESWEDLSDKKISLARGTTMDVFATETYPDAEIVRFESIADAFMALKTGKVDVLLEATAAVNNLAKENEDMEPMPVAPARAAFACMAVAQGDQDWLNYVNNFIRNNMYSGTFQEYYKEHFGTEIPELYNY